MYNLCCKVWKGPITESFHRRGCLLRNRCHQQAAILRLSGCDCIKDSRAAHFLWSNQADSRKPGPRVPRVTCRNGSCAMAVEPLAFLLMLGTRLADMETDVSCHGKTIRHRWPCLDCNPKNNSQLEGIIQY